MTLREPVLDDTFKALMQGIQLEAKPEDMLCLPMDGQRVAVDFLAGSQLVDDILH